MRCLRVLERSGSETLAVLFQRGNVRSLVFKYVVMLFDFCLVVVVSLDSL